MARLIACDFDHTINRNDSKLPDERYSKPYEGAKDALIKLREDGHKVMIFSCNNPKWIKEWLDHWEIPFDYIWEGAKPVCDAYIDDRGVGFRGDWKATLKDVNELFEVKAPWD